MLHRVQNGVQFLNYPCCSDLTLQTTLVNTSTGLLPASFFPSLRKSRSLLLPSPGPAWAWGAAASLCRGTAAARGTSGQAWRLSATAGTFPRAGRRSPPHNASRRGRHTHLSWPAGSWGSACSRLGAPLPAASAAGPAPGPSRRPAHRRAPRKSHFSSGSGAKLHMGLNKP